MATTAIFGQAVYGDSRYGVLLVSGSTATTFNTSGVVRGQGRLQGTSVLNTDVYGQGQALGIRQIEGKSSLVFEELGSLKGSTELKSSSTLSFISSGSIYGTGSLITTTQIVFNPQLTLGGKTSLVGDTSLTFSGLSIVKGTARARGNTKSLFQLNGYLNRFVIKGSVELTFNLHNIDYTLGTTLPWYNTSDPSNNNLPYDNSNLSVYYNLYENTEGESQLPYQITEEEAA